jgi:O-6-methylguanine DNA methyltransferase
MESKMVKYDIIGSTPVGIVGVAVTGKGLGYVSMAVKSEDDFVARLRDRYPGKEVVKDGAAASPAVRQLEEYFQGSRREFDLELDLEGRTPFQEKVLRLVASIPYGRTKGYGQVAGEAGNPGAARAVGSVMHNNPIPLVIPCHRVLSAGGKLGGFGSGIENKKRLLNMEGAAWKD